MNRRAFISKAASLSLIPASLSYSVSNNSDTDSIATNGPILQRRKFTSPVIIESLELFECEGTWFVRARSTDGAEGWAVSHDKKMPLYYPIFLKVVAPHMIGKDARDIDRLVDSVFLVGSNYKMQGQPFWVPVASAEFAILDLLGRIKNQPVAELLGRIRRRQIPLYIANNHRELGPEESLKRIVASVESIDAKAVKFKLGGRMKVIDQVPNRTERLIPMVADALGDRCTLYADANSSYVNTDKAIAIGKLLQKNGFSFYEEPCPFDYLEETKKVADALEIPIAWGEQESSQWRFKWMIENGGVQIPQPDIIYYGGLIRSLRVAKWAEQQGLDCTPHISGGGLGFLYMAIYASCCPNPGPFQEYKGVNRSFPWESPGVDFTIEKGLMPAPLGPGIGVDIDPDYLKQAKQIH